MPVVPTYQRTERRGPIQRPRDSGQAGATLAQSGQALGRGLTDLGTGVDVYLDRRAEVTARERDLALSRDLRHALTDPDAGYLAQRGVNAEDGRAAFDEQVEELRRRATEGVDDPRAQRRIVRAAEERIARARESANRHQIGERRAYETDLGRQRIEQSILEMREAPGDREARERALGIVASEVRAQAIREGADPETIPGRIRAAQSAMLRQYLIDRVTADGPEGEANRQRLGRLRRGDPVVTEAESFDIIWDIESARGQHPTLVGQPTRYGRAYGEYQMLESTARRQAAESGIEWRPDLLRGDDEEARAYQRRLGQAHIRSLRAQFDDPVLAMLAYHQGAPNVRRFLEVYGDPNEIGWRRWHEMVRAGRRSEDGRRWVIRPAPNGAEYLDKIFERVGVSPRDADEYRALTPDDRRAVLDQWDRAARRTETLRNADRRDVDRVLSQEETLLEYGEAPLEDDRLSQEALRGLFGREDGDQRWRNRQGAIRQAEAIRGIASASPDERSAEIARRVARIEGARTPEDRIREIEALAGYRQALGRVAELAAEDPAALVGRSSEAVREAATAFESPEEGAEAAAAQRYADVILGEQARVGVAQPRILTNAHAAALSARFAGLPPEQAMVEFALMRETWGRHAGQVIRELVEHGDMAPEVALAAQYYTPEVAGEAPAPGVAREILEAHALPIAELRRSVDGAGGIEDAIVAAFQPMVEAALTSGVPPSAVNSHVRAAVRVALARVQRGADASDVAEGVYRDMIANRFEIVLEDDVSAVIPKAYDAATIARAARRILSSEDELRRMAAVPPLGFGEQELGAGAETAEDRAELWREVIRSAGRFVMAESGDGLRLVVDLPNGDGPPTPVVVVDAEGRPIEYSYRDLSSGGLDRELLADQVDEYGSIGDGAAP